jgi:hypothetical protein
VTVPSDAKGQVAPTLTASDVKSYADSLVYVPLAEQKPVDVVTVLQRQTWAAAVVRPPYREFPNVLLFRLVAGRWVPQKEGLLLGHQFFRSGVLDLHTVGRAMDLGVYRDGQRAEKPAEFVREMRGISEKSGLVLVPLGEVFHQHQAGEKSYVLDRSFLMATINDLYGGYPEKFPKDSCVMLDVPEIRAASFFEEARPRLRVRTSNGQVWEATWSGAAAGGELTELKVKATWESADAAAHLDRPEAQSPVQRLAALRLYAALGECECLGTPDKKEAGQCYDEAPARARLTECQRNRLNQDDNVVACQIQRLELTAACLEKLGCGQQAKQQCQKAAEAVRCPDTLTRQLEKCPDPAPSTP